MKLRDYDFANNPRLDNHFGPDWAITRATLGTTYDGYGWVRHIDAGVPRFRGGYYTNNLLPTDSEDLTGWTNTRIDETVITDDLPSLRYGIKKATQLTSQVTTENTHVDTSPVFNTIVGRYYMMSFFIKEDGYDEIRLDFSAAGFPNNTNAYYNTTTGWGTFGAGGAVAYGDADAGNGWKRAWMVQEADETIGTATIGFLLSGPEGEDIIFSADGVSGIKMTGFMVSDVTGQFLTDNHLLQSEDLSDAQWLAVNGNKGTESAVDSQGVTKSIGYIVDDDVDTNVRIQNVVSNTDPGGIEYGDQLWYVVESKKRGSSGDWIYFSEADSGAGFYYNVGSGAMGSTQGSAQNVQATDLGNGWYRLAFSLEISHTDRAPRMNIYVAESDGDLGILDPDTTWSIYLDRAQVSHKKPDETEPPGYLQTTSAEVVKFAAPEYVYTDGTATGLWNGPALGWEMERARTNLHTYSEDFGQWTAGSNNAAFVGNEAIAPDGSSTADYLVDDGLTGTSTNVLFSNPITYSTSSTYVTGFFLKAAGLDWARITVISLGALDISAYFDLANGAVGATLGANNDDQGIVDVGNGWYYCWIAYTSDAVDTTGVVVIRPATADNNSTVDRDGTSSIFVWGAMTEQTSSSNLKPCNYIRTAGSSQTRNLEAISTSPEGYPGDGIVTAYVRYSTDSTNGGSALNINKGVNDYLYFATTFNGNSPEVRNYITTGDDGQLQFSALTRDRTSFIEVAVSCEPGNMVGVESDANGGTTQTDTSITCFNEPTKFLMNDDFNGGSELDGIVSRIVLWAGATETADLELIAENPLDAIPTVVDRKKSRDRFRRRYRRT